MKQVLALILLLAPLAQSDMGVVVSSSSIAVGKEVYAGDTSALASRLAARTAANPALSFVTYDLSNSGQASTFNGTTLPGDLQLQAWVTELSTTSAAVAATAPTYVAASAVTQIQTNKNMARIIQLRQLLGIQ